MEIDIHILDKRLPPNKYFLYLEGGSHFFHERCSSEKNIEPIYREKIWPFIFNLKSKKIVIPGLSKTDHYPRVHFKSSADENIFIYMHQVVALIIPNPENKTLINHINGNTFDYRRLNLEWSDHSSNSTDVKRKRLNYDNLYDFFESRKNICK